MRTGELFGIYVGQLVYDIDADKTYSWNGTEWIEIPNLKI
jgi:hypothetical protein